MSIPLKVTSVGNSAALILSKEALRILRADKGDTLYLTETAEGGTLVPKDPDSRAELEALNSVMDDHREVLRVLAGR
jgi:putative addiction module antidote